MALATTPRPTATLSLNFARLRDPDIDAALDAARQSATDDEAIAAAEEINRIMAEHCYNVPLELAAVGACISDPDVQGFGQLVLPDGEPAVDGGRRRGHVLDPDALLRRGLSPPTPDSMRYVVQRLTRFLIVFFIVTFTVMVLLRLGLNQPGDPARTMLGGFADAGADRRRPTPSTTCTTTTWSSTSTGCG